MAFFKKRKAQTAEGADLTGPIRLVNSLGDLSGVRPGDIVLIEQEDIDLDSASTFSELGIIALVNSHASVTGNEHVRGAEHLVDNDIVILDEVGTGVWASLRNGDVVRVEGNSVYREDAVLATGVLLTAERIEQRIAEASSGISNRLDAVVANAADLVRRERAMLIDGERIPQLTHRVEGRPAVIVNSADDSAQQLKALRRFILDFDPVIVAVGDGYRDVLRAGYGIDILLGHADELEKPAIDKADEIVLVAADGRWDRPERFEKHGKHPVLFTAPGTPADLAVLLVDHHDASLIVLVGSATGIEELTSRDPVDVAGNLVTRLRTSATLVDAQAVNFFLRKRIGIWAPLLLLLMGCLALIAAISFASSGEGLWNAISLSIGSLSQPLRGVIS